MKRLVTAVIVALLLIFAVAGSCRRIPPDQIGLRILNVGGGDSAKGLVQEDFDAGFYRSIWLWESWDTLPRSVQRIAFSDSTDQRGPTDAPAIAAKTKDGDSVSIEAVVLVRIGAGKGHIVYVDSGRGDNFVRLARDLSAPEIATTVATIKTEEIYDFEKRRTALKELFERLRTILMTQKSLELVSVEIMEVRFDAKYEDQLRKKKVASENRRLEMSNQERVKQAGERDKIVQETTNIVLGIQNDLKNKQRTIVANNKQRTSEIDAEAMKKAAARRAEATQFKLSKEAEGSQLLKEAEAYATDLQRKALTLDQGNYVAYLTAQNFPVKQITMPSVGVDWLNPVWLATHAGAILKLDSESATSKPAKAN